MGYYAESFVGMVPHEILLIEGGERSSILYFQKNSYELNAQGINFGLVTSASKVDVNSVGEFFSNQVRPLQILFDLRVVVFIVFIVAFLILFMIGYYALSAVTALHLALMPFLLLALITNVALQLYLVCRIFGL